MAQPSVARYFTTRKRAAIDDHKIDSARKILKLDPETDTKIKHNTNLQINVDKDSKLIINKEASSNGSSKNAKTEGKPLTRKVIKAEKTKRINGGGNQDIQTFLNNMKIPERCVTPPNHQVEKSSTELNEIKKKLCRSSKLSELRASINNFKKSAEALKVAEKRTNDVIKNSEQATTIERKSSAVPESPKLKSFKSLEFEVVVSPQKTQSPEKPYLSPRKEPSVRRNLLNALSPTKSSLALTVDSCSKELFTSTKQGLKLPFKYRTLAEIFRGIDTVSQILYNRKEIITLQKLKPAVEEMLKRNLTQKHLSQIKFIYPDAYDYRQEKLKRFGSGMRQEEWNLVLTPNIGNSENMTSEILISRRRKLFEKLIDLVKDYHNEFLLSLTPPITIPKDKITRWHPEFDLEKVLDIEESAIPQPPEEEVYTTGKEVLEKARQLFNCNTRMEQALAKLKAAREANPEQELSSSQQPISILKGIPKALLEKVRQKQAAKALVSMTRSDDKEKEIQMYSRLPEIARLIRNLFVSEKKGVLELDFVIEKLGNSYRCFLTKADMEDHLKAISDQVAGWLVFHKLRNSVFLKLAKNANLSVVLSKLEKIAKEKSES